MANAPDAQGAEVKDGANAFETAYIVMICALVNSALWEVADEIGMSWWVSLPLLAIILWENLKTCAEIIQWRRDAARFRELCDLKARLDEQERRV